MNDSHRYAEVVLPLPLEKTFHYAIPGRLAGAVRAGVRVAVPFGPRAMVGYVTGTVAETNIVKGMKEIRDLVDPEPVFTPEMMQLGRWLSERYLCSLGEALSSVVSPVLRPPVRQQTRPAGPVAVAEPVPAFVKPQLTPAQAAAASSVVAAMDRNAYASFLLHGVTGSGKTEVYLTLIEETIRRGRSAIFLLPEISLTPQFIAIVRRRFPGLVGIWHSRLAAGERYRTWQAARAGTVRILLGARSALFAPFEKPGLIIVDEEHEPSYKQEQKPAYQTRDAAMERCRLNNAVAVFGSATPSLEMYHRASTGDGITLLSLPERIDGRPLPPVRVIDPSKLHKRSRIISESMVTALNRVLARREQAILFLNRRGFAPGVMCRECGKVWECPNCSVSLVYHRDPESLHCHYCDHHIPWPGICPACNSKQMAVFGVGTQKVEEELNKIFPQARVARLDRDTTARKGVYEQVYEDFRSENCDILLGTQMVTKGFDFPRVTLAGVIDADTALYLPDFRSAERTFQLITQVAGRSGRGTLGGEVVVQSRHPEHYALRAAQTHDFKAFFAQEIEFRRQLNYPPFCSLINVMLRGKKEENVEEAARLLAETATAAAAAAGGGVDILGPSPAARVKMHGLYRWQMLFKGTPAALRAVADAVRGADLPSGVAITFDVDPQDIL